MIMCVLLCYPVSIRIYYQQGGLFLVFTLSLGIFQQYFKHCAILSIFQVVDVTNREQNLLEKINLNSLKVMDGFR